MQWNGKYSSKIIFSARCLLQTSAGNSSRQRPHAGRLRFVSVNPGQPTGRPIRQLHPARPGRQLLPSPVELQIRIRQRHRHHVLFASAAVGHLLPKDLPTGRRRSLSLGLFIHRQMGHRQCHSGRKHRLRRAHSPADREPSDPGVDWNIFRRVSFRDTRPFIGANFWPPICGHGDSHCSHDRGPKAAEYFAGAATRKREQQKQRNDPGKNVKWNGIHWRERETGGKCGNSGICQVNFMLFSGA